MQERLYRRAYLQLMKTSSILEQRIKKILKPSGITHIQFHILRMLAEAHPSPSKPKDIKESLIISSPDVTRILDRMVAKGWIDRNTCPSNRRQVDVTISHSGRELFHKVNGQLQNGIDHYLSDKITEEEIQGLLRIVGRINS